MATNGSRLPCSGNVKLVELWGVQQKTEAMHPHMRSTKGGTTDPCEHRPKVNEHWKRSKQGGLCQDGREELLSLPNEQLEKHHLRTCQYGTNKESSSLATGPFAKPVLEEVILYRQGNIQELNLAFQFKLKQAEHEKRTSSGGRPLARNACPSSGKWPSC